MTLEHIKSTLDRYFFLTSTIRAVSRVRYELLYTSPSGVELFRVSVYFAGLKNWQLGGISHSLSGQLNVLHNLCFATKEN